MGKQRYIAEFELRASPRMLFPYLTSPAGLAQWFADDVKLDDRKVFNFIWDDTPHYAKITALRANKYVKFEFLAKDGPLLPEVAFLEFRLDQNEMTQSSFLKITDYSDTENEDDLRELWSQLVGSLREAVGG
jgi:uncharacterized protein YndB with AHSA1/START domain